MQPETLRSFIGNSNGQLPVELQQLIRPNECERYTRVAKITPLMESVMWQILQCLFQGIMKRMYLESKALELVSLFLGQESEIQQVERAVKPPNAGTLERIQYTRYFSGYFGDDAGTIQTALLPDNQTLEREYFYERSKQSDYRLSTDVVGKFTTGSIKHQLLFGVDLGRISGEFSGQSREIAPRNFTRWKQHFKETAKVFGKTEVAKQLLNGYYQRVEKLKQALGTLHDEPKKHESQSFHASFVYVSNGLYLAPHGVLDDIEKYLVNTP
ncbi:hypothetical protein H6G17_01105 [Chroococcidiopsis sp. FACHB-1243]|uniref:hypothetical protein n=1 Tax=Chroococcidiopsis sp. [FACHB-1243] TaxID=2692781 RepID=UPI001783673A|nr:hypothetical protein [Chroococcidiopsis sp. [FACHB-1243]]MBD2304121.1 hypothetical protein [Chroococcidiopsis sp. [FACHB-1243]]